MKPNLLKAYELIQEEKIEDVQSVGYLLKHKKSGARVMILENEDENKVFNIAFRTPPKNSTGVAHILEHSVLCGSKEFPLKDPFIELAKGSLNTFLNAMTYPDKTMYPIASCNTQDFNNLMHVYLDAVFYPNIYQHEEIFCQEGWSYHLENKDDELTYNGVVYSEMKGAFSSPEEVLDRTIFNTLFPDTPYGVESGGDPDYITDLSYEEFLAFHKKYYHPSNSFIYLYGNCDMEERLQWLDENYLNAFDLEKIDSKIPYQEAFSKPMEVEMEYPVSEDEEEEENSYLSYNVVVGDSLDVELGIAFNILEYALISAPGAPLKKILLDNKIGKDIMGDYSDGILQPFFSVIAKNADPKRKSEFLSLLENELKSIVENGMDTKALEAGINYFEFRFREADYASYPKGLMYGIDVFDSWLYDDGKPFIYLQQLKVYESLKKKIHTGYFENLISKYLLGNPHAAVVVLNPEKGLATKKEQELQEKLNQYKAGLSDEEIEQLVKKTHHLKAYQEEEETPEALASIPMLQREDIRKEGLKLYNIERKIENNLILFHDLATNGIAYMTILFPTDDVPAELVPYMALLKSVLGYVSTEHFTYGELFNEINANTGGIISGIQIFNAVEDRPYQSMFGIRGKFLYEKTAFVFQILSEMLNTSKLDEETRLYEIIAKAKSRMQMGMASAGHGTAAQRAVSYFSELAKYQEEIGGIDYYRFIDDLEKNFEQKKAVLIENMQQLMGLIFDPEKMMVSFSADETGYQYLEKELPQFKKNIAGISKNVDGISENIAGISGNITGVFEDVTRRSKNVAGVSEDENETIAEAAVSAPKKLNEAFKTPGQVQYVAKAGDFVKAGYAFTGVMHILKTILGYDYLWMNVRVKGGAYGCMSSFKRNGEMFFVSYRDPNLKKTIETFDQTADYIRAFTADERQMTKYIIGTISGIDTPMTPATKGEVSMSAYFNHVDEEMLQRERDQILCATDKDIQRLADVVEAVMKQNNLCVVGSEGAIMSEKDLFMHVENLK